MAFSPETYGAVQSLIEASMTGAGAIKGQDGAPGKDGIDGAPGKSAYEVAVDNGFEGTEEEWLQSLTMEKTLTMEEYEALSEEEKNNGMTYYIDDGEEEAEDIKAYVNAEIETVSDRVTTTEQDIAKLDVRVTTAEGDVVEVRTAIDTLASAATYICDNLT